MTREEAIKKLQKQKAEYLDEWVDYSGVAEAFDMAIEALKEQENMIPLDGEDIMFVTTEEYEALKTQQEVTEKVMQELADKINDAYAKGYKDAKREIAVQGRK